jgi:DNA polymerase/3'-5' exonuclease PolX
MLPGSLNEPHGASSMRDSRRKGQVSMFAFTQTVQFLSEDGAALPQAPVTNQQVAEVLFNIATLLEMQQANPYRIQAYRNAARGMLTLAEPAIDIIRRGEELRFDGLGVRLRRKITELLTTGHMTFYDDLCEESLPDDARALMSVEHIGPRTALRLIGPMNIHTVEQLWEEAHSRRLQKHYGFGEKSERRLERAAEAVLRSPQPPAGAAAVAIPDSATDVGEETASARVESPARAA